VCLGHLPFHYPLLTIMPFPTRWRRAPLATPSPLSKSVSSSNGSAPPTPNCNIWLDSDHERFTDNTSASDASLGGESDKEDNFVDAPDTILDFESRMQVLWASANASASGSSEASISDSESSEALDELSRGAALLLDELEEAIADVQARRTPPRRRKAVYRGPASALWSPSGSPVAGPS
jgi:hypothetical protein